MNDLISRKSVSAWLYNMGYEKLSEYVLDEKRFPSIDRQQGKWILSSDEQYEYCTCSECGYENGENWMICSDIPYCQNCGAKMKGTNDE